MDGRTYDDRITAARNAVFGNNQLSTISRSLIRSIEFQDAVDNEDDPDDIVSAIVQCGSDTVAELALYRHYGLMIESIGIRFGRYPAFGPDDGHQEGALALLEMARNGSTDFTRRAKRALTNRVATEALRFSRAVTGFSRDQVRTVNKALEQAEQDWDTAREIVTGHPDVNRRMKADTFDAIVTSVLPTQHISDESGEDRAGPATSADDMTRDYVDELLHHETVSADEYDVLCRAYGLAGLAPHTDADLGQHYGVDRSVAGKARRRALATLRNAARDIAAA